MNGSVSEAYWGQSNQITPQLTSHHKISGCSNGTGWNEPTTIPQNGNSPNQDDGTSLWGNSQQGNLLGSEMYLFLTENIL